MSTAIPPMPAETAPRLSEPARVINTFIAPSKTFTDICRRPSWAGFLLPFVLAWIFSFGYFYTVDKKVGIESIMTQNMEHMPQFIQDAMQRIPPEQQQKSLERQRRSVLYYSWINYLIIGAIAAALFMVAFNFGLEAGVPYKNALTIYFYAMLPKILWALLAIVVLYKGVDPGGFNMENPVTTNIGAFFDRWTTNKLLYTFLSFIDIFTIWSVILLAIGFMRSSAKKISMGAALAAVICVYVLGILIRSAVPF
ncbi:MAG: hypothetical protein DMG65_03620 [Candidatus Angelobacter sp. Gp1-AA117]|nr:MAG: hypothetical protein DMG65_03620 [Candidatus Angelobacter sp. Gp1-AA117]